MQSPTPPPSARPWKVAAAFAVLFLAYQLPEGLGLLILGSFSIQATLLLAFFPVAWAVGRALTGRPLEVYALDQASRFWRPLAGCFVLAIAAKAFTVALGCKLGVFAWQPASADPAQAAKALLSGLVITFAPSIAEDIVTRGFWYRASGLRWHPAAFVLASSAIYVANHIYRLAAGPGEWAMLFSFGLAYGLAVVRFGSLWPAVGLHWGWNYGNLFTSTLWPYETLSTPGSQALAIAAHLTLAAIVVLLRRRASPVSPAVG